MRIHEGASWSDAIEAFLRHLQAMGRSPDTRALRRAQLYLDMTGRDGDFSPDYSDATTALWVVGIGVLLLAVALTVTLVRRR